MSTQEKILCTTTMLYISIPSDKSAMLQKTELLKLVTGYYWRLTILIFGHGGYEICRFGIVFHHNIREVSII